VAEAAEAAVARATAHTHTHIHTHTYQHGRVRYGAMHLPKILKSELATAFATECLEKKNQLVNKFAEEWAQLATDCADLSTA